MLESDWKRRLNALPTNGKKKEITVIRGGETISLPTEKVDQSNGNHLRSWDEISLTEKVDRLGKFVSEILSELEKE